MLTHKYVVSACFASVVGLLSGAALAGGSSGGNGGCNSLPNWGQLKSAVTSSITPSSGANGGLGFNMWGVIVDNSGIVCAVAFSGGNFTSQWLASRVIAAQKANTANSLSLSSGVTPGGSAVGTAGLALSTANLFSAVQPGGSLYGLQASNPVDTEVGYGNRPGLGPIDPPPVSGSTFGTPSDPMVGQRIGGVNVFGGGLGLYKGGVRVGGLGVSGDTVLHRSHGRLADAPRSQSGSVPGRQRPGGHFRGRYLASGQHHLRHHAEPERRHGDQRERIRTRDLLQYSDRSGGRRPACGTVTGRRRC